MATVSIKVGNIYHTNISYIRISKDLSFMSNYFVATLPNVFEAIPSEWNIHMGDLCEIYVNNRYLLFTGYIDDIDLSYSSNRSHQIILTGRDKVSDLLDCSNGQPVNEWKNQTVVNIIKTLCSPFNISVTVDPSAEGILDAVISSYKANEGDLVGDLILRLCRDNGVLAVSLGNGVLTLTRGVATELMSESIQLGRNTLSGKLLQSNADRFSSYKVRGMGQGADTKEISDYVSPFGSSSDSIITRTRPLTILAEGAVNSGICQTRANGEASIRAGLSRMFLYTITQWDLRDNSVWDIHKLADVQDVFLNISATLFINSAVFEKGTSTDMPETVTLGLVEQSTYQASGNTSRIRTLFDN